MAPPPVQNASTAPNSHQRLRIQTKLNSSFSRRQFIPGAAKANLIAHASIRNSLSRRIDRTGWAPTRSERAPHLHKNNPLALHSVSSFFFFFVGLLLKL